MGEITQELNGIVGDEPVTDDEVSRAKDSRTLTLPGQWETNADVAGSLQDLVRFGYEDDYFDSYGARVRALDSAQVSAAASTLLKPDRLVWVVVGDLGKIEEGIRELGYGDVHLIDADGNPAAQ